MPIQGGVPPYFTYTPGTKSYPQAKKYFAKNSQKLVDYFACNIKLLEKKH